MIDSPLFDHLRRPHQHQWWNRQAEYLGAARLNYLFESCWASAMRNHPGSNTRIARIPTHFSLRSRFSIADCRKNKPGLASRILYSFLLRDFCCCLVPFAFSSPNDFVRSCQHVRWNRQAKCLRGLQIDHELELRRLLHWQLGRLGTFKNFVDVVCGALEILRFVG